MDTTYDVIVVGGGPAGATAADDLARRGRKVALLDRAGRIKPCGGAIPPRLMRDFDYSRQPDRGAGARAPVSSRRRRGKWTCPSKDGFVGMVDREVFDEWLRRRAAHVRRERRSGTFENDRARSRWHGAGRLPPKWRRMRREMPGPHPRAQRHRRRRRKFRRGARGHYPQAASPRMSSPIMRSSARRAKVSTGRAATSTTRAVCRRISMPGYSRMATPPVSASAAPEKGFSLRGAVKALRAQAGLARLRNHPHGRRANSPASAPALGQWPRCRSGWRRGRRGRAGLGRRDLLCHVRRAHGR